MTGRATRRLAVPFVVLAAVLLAGCTSGADARSPAPQPTRSTIDVGQVGELPQPAQAGEAVNLVVPRGMLEIFGSFPLGSIVGFQVPVRNDGSEPIEIRQLEPG